MSAALPARRGRLRRASPFPPPRRTVAITNATVAIGDGSAPDRERAPSWCAAARSSPPGPGVAVPAGAQVIDGTGKWVTPGMFAAMTDLGLFDVDGGRRQQRLQQAQRLAVQRGARCRARDQSRMPSTIAVSRAGGVTRASVVPAAGGIDLRRTGRGDRSRRGPAWPSRSRAPSSRRAGRKRRAHRRGQPRDQPTPCCATRCARRAITRQRRPRYRCAAGAARRSKRATTSRSIRASSTDRRQRATTMCC